MKFAVPVAQGVLCPHFGHCEQFAIIEADDGQIKNKELLIPPPHEPGVLPRWLSDLGVEVIIAGGMGRRALDLFAQKGIRVEIGAPSAPPEEVVAQYLKGSLITGQNICDH
ncbi:MAG: NifB/NifX family molybdenum-iron cluster-binding protein [Deltaproteobacteria bacterium]|nr:NifB/NifX family molybdenum-iron cluster-binding protein [Deltaproteobacteria bacterium]MBW2070655.1 NifB/NifX family molybdenum-iron cluster-binding protein [Deltaproteobacteria bacterium]